MKLSAPIDVALAYPGHVAAFNAFIFVMLIILLSNTPVDGPRRTKRTEPLPVWAAAVMTPVIYYAATLGAFP